MWSQIHWLHRIPVEIEGGMSNKEDMFWPIFVFIYIYSLTYPSVLLKVQVVGENILFWEPRLIQRWMKFLLSYIMNSWYLHTLTLSASIEGFPNEKSWGFLLCNSDTKLLFTDHINKTDICVSISAMGFERFPIIGRIWLALTQMATVACQSLY